MWISEFYPSSAVSFLAGLLWQNGSIALLYRTILMFLARSCNFDLLPCSVLFGFTLFCLFSIFCTFDCFCLVVPFWIVPAWSLHGFHHFDFPCLVFPFLDFLACFFLFGWISLLGCSFLDFLVGYAFFCFLLIFLAWLSLFGFAYLLYPILTCRLVDSLDIPCLFISILFSCFGHYLWILLAHLSPYRFPLLGRFPLDLPGLIVIFRFSSLGRSVLFT